MYSHLLKNPKGSFYKFTLIITPTTSPRGETKTFLIQTRGEANILSKYNGAKPWNF